MQEIIGIYRYNKNYSEYLHWMTKLGCTLTKILCVYILVLCMYKANWDGATKHIFTKHRQFLTSQVMSYQTWKHLAKNFFNKYNIEKCLQFNQVNFETWLWACSGHMLKINLIPYIDKINITCTLYTLSIIDGFIILWKCII